MWRAICGAALTFCILFWNVENYFDPFDDPLKNDNEFTPAAERHWTWQRFEAKRDGLAQTIVAVADETGDLPALVGLAEVENRMVVSQLVHKTMLSELGYDFVHRESPDERGIDVALLYRKDLLHVIAVDSLRIPGVVTRDILYVKMRFRIKSGMTSAVNPDMTPTVIPDLTPTVIPDMTPTVIPGLTRNLDTNEDDIIHVFVVHLPSKRGGARASQDRRQTALAVLEHAVDSLLADSPTCNIVVMGDFNDGEARVAGLSVPPFDGPPAAPGTLKYHGRWEQIDWFCVSPALDSSVRMQIFAPPFLQEPDAAWLGTKPRRTYIGPRYNGGLSDHLPVYMKVIWP